MNEKANINLTKPILIISVYGNILVSNLMCYLADDYVYREVSRLQHHCWLTILIIDVGSSVVNYYYVALNLICKMDISDGYTFTVIVFCGTQCPPSVSDP